MNGRAPGISTRRYATPGGVRNIRITRTYWLSMALIPMTVLMASGNTQEMKTVKMIERSPSPNQRMAMGTHAIPGIG
jgi:NADH:ubiquinone oxidoreductase subunit H